MRVAMFTDTFCPQVNGVATSIATLSRELGRRGHQVTIFTPTSSRKLARDQRPFRSKNVTVVALRSVPLVLYPDFRISLLFLHTVMRHMYRFRPDVIHVHTPLTVGISGVVAARMLRIPLMGTNHVYLTEKNIDFFDSVYDSEVLKTTLARVTRRYMNLFYGRCTLLLTPSRELIVHMKHSGYRKRLEYCSNGIDIKKFRLLSGAEREAMKQQYGLRRRVVLHVGRLSDEKHVDEVIRAFARLRSRDDVSLLIVGDGPARSDLRRLCTQLGISHDVVFTGMIAHETLVESGVLSIADVFVTASTMESQGMVILEAMASGLPIVCVGEAGVTELIDGNGLLVPPHATDTLATSLQQVLSDDSLREKMAKKSLLLAKKYDIESIARHIADLYAELTAA